MGGIILLAALAGRDAFAQQRPARSPPLPAGASVAPVRPPPATSATPRARVEEKPIGSLNSFEIVKDLAVSIDLNHMAIVGTRGDRQFVQYDGVDGPLFDWVVPGTLDFCPDGVRIAYIVQTADDTRVVIAGVPGKGYYAIDHNRLAWTDDGKHCAYAARYRDGSGAIVLDGVEGPRYERADAPLFGPGEHQFAFRAGRAGKQFVVRDAKEGKPYEAVDNLVYSPNGKHLAYIAREGGKEFLVLDGEEGQHFTAVGYGPWFSANGAKLIAIVLDATKPRIVVNGRLSAPYDAIIPGDLALSKDGRHIAYAVENAGKQFMVLDDVPRPPFASIIPRTARFSPDSKHLAFGIRQEGRQQVVIDGIPGKAFDGIEPAAPIFSPDGKRVAYRARIGEKPVVVIDGKVIELSDRAGQIAFSPDSKHVAYLRLRDHNDWLVWDGVEIAGPFEPSSPARRLVFDDNSTLHFITQRQKNFARVTVHEQ